MCTKTGIKDEYQNWDQAWVPGGPGGVPLWPSVVSAVPGDERYVTKLGLNMCTRTGIKPAYPGVQGACPRQAVTGTGGMAKLARSVP